VPFYKTQAFNPGNGGLMDVLRQVAVQAGKSPEFNASMDRIRRTSPGVAPGARRHPSQDLKKLTPGVKGAFPGVNPAMLKGRG
jgi:hypothetical protein